MIKKYGALYNWYAVQTGKLAPAGWHVPSTTEVATLINYLVQNGYNWDGTTDMAASNKVAKSLAATTDWYAFGADTGDICTDLTINNRSGFSALPGGFRYADGSFVNIGSKGYWWTTTDDGELFAYYSMLFADMDRLDWRSFFTATGFSVRLIRDN
jgi:uncharacterized protein (TIGR02145 family)